MHPCIAGCLRIALWAPALLAAADLRNATIVIDRAASKPQQKAAAMLAEEIEKRTQLRLKIANARAPGQPAFTLRRANSGPAEGFTLTSAAASRNR